MTAAAASIPFEEQTAGENNRACGAACLSMVYRSFGKEIAQAEIWPAIAKENRFGSLASTTHLIAKDALSRNFVALAFQARHPLLSLRLCREFGIRAILNHRLKPDVPTGHYTVLVDIDDQQVTLHDPFYGPSRRLSHAELLELWQPRYANSEIVGSMLVAIAAKPFAVGACHLCGTAVPTAIECPRCKQQVNLEPNLLLGCVSSTCIARGWKYVCCASCDYLWSFSSQDGVGDGARADGNAQEKTGAAAGRISGAASSAAEALDFTAVFAELDKFCNHVLSLPAAATHPEIKQAMSQLAARREDLKTAGAEAMAHLRAHKEQMAKMVEQVKQKQEAHRRKTEELTRPSPPLDGNALGRALLKSLGFPTK